MKREVFLTKDGSTTLFIKEWNETYHSKHGAIQEAYHVFIKNGLSLFYDQSISILEIGFGTGLNTFITLLEAQNYKLSVQYIAVEAFPVTTDEIDLMNFSSQMNTIDSSTFKTLHQIAWEEETPVSSNFSLIKRNQFFQDIEDNNRFDLIYFDAFGYDVQPELWSLSIFDKMFKALKPNGVLVTYACRTLIKNNMAAAGFKVEKLLGAPGKREMLRAIKPSL